MSRLTSRPSSGGEAPSLRRAVCRTLLILSALLFLPPVLGAQSNLKHPHVTDVSPRAPRPGQTVTIRGTDLAPRGWTPKLLYKRKYRYSPQESLPLQVTAGTLTFAAPNDMAPDSLFLLYEPGASRDGDGLTTDERFFTLPRLELQAPPRLDATGMFSRRPSPDQGLTGGITMSGGRSFFAIVGGRISIRGEYLLRAPLAGGSAQSAAPSVASVSSAVRDLVPNASELSKLGPLNPSGGSTSGLTILATLEQLAPTVRFAGNTLTVTGARYDRQTLDEVLVTLPALPHNTTGYLVVSTPAGSDSIPASYVLPPRIDAIVANDGNGGLTPAQSPLSAEGGYAIKGANLTPEFPTTQGYRGAFPIEIRFGGSTADLDLDVASVRNDTLVGVALRPRTTPSQPGAFTYTTVAGTASTPPFVIIPRPQRLDVTGLVATPNEVIGGTGFTLTASFNPTPSNFATAGAVTLRIDRTLAAIVRAPAANIPVTANPLEIPIAVNEVTAPITGYLSLRHESSNMAQNVTVTIRPPYPSAVTLQNDTVSGGLAPRGTVNFDRAGPATVFLSSSDPSIAAVPPSVRRTVGPAYFPITTSAVTEPRSVTLTAAVAGTVATRTITVVPGRIAAFTAPTTSLMAGESVEGQLTFDVPVANTALRLATSEEGGAGGTETTSDFSGTTRTVRVAARSTITAPTRMTVTATANGSTRALTLQVVPNSIAQLTPSTTSGAPGSSISLTVRLTKPAKQRHVVSLESSDPAVVSPPSLFTFEVGEDTKLVSLSLPAGQTQPATAQVTASLRVGNGVTDAVISRQSVTLSVRP